MGNETIHILASIVSVLASGLVGVAIYYINSKVYTSVSKLEIKIMAGISGIREEQIKVASALNAHDSNDQVRHKEFDRRLESLEDRL